MTKRALAPALLALLPLVSACVSVEEAPVQQGMILPDQRTVLLAYGAPGPFVREDDSKGESAAKAIPGLALVVQDAQDDRDRDNSRDLQTYLPPFDAAAAVLAETGKQLAKTGHRGKWVAAAEAEISTQTVHDLNGASDVVEWKRKYYDVSMSPARDYGRMLSLDDALVFELNVAPGVLQDGEGNATPTLYTVAKLYRAKTMRQLWRHEETVSDEGAKRLLYDFKVRPQDLVESWSRLAPQLGEKLAGAYAAGLTGKATLPPELQGSMPAADPTFPPPGTAAPATQGLSPLPQ